MRSLCGSSKPRGSCFALAAARRRFPPGASYADAGAYTCPRSPAEAGGGPPGGIVVCAGGNFFGAPPSPRLAGVFVVWGVGAGSKTRFAGRVLVLLGGTPA